MTRLFAVCAAAWLFLAQAALVGASRPDAATAPNPCPAAMRGDGRLAPRMTLAAKNRPLGELLPALGKQIHVALTASRDTADDKVTLFLDQRPAAEVLGLLARHFDFDWTRRDDGYELIQTTASKRREAARRQADVAEQFHAINAHMRRLAQLADRPREDLETLRKGIEERLKAPGVIAAERARLNDEDSALCDALDDIGTVAIAAYRCVTGSRRARLLREHRLRLSTADGSLPRHVAAGVHQVLAAYVSPDEPSSAWQALPTIRADIEISLSEPEEFCGGPQSPGDTTIGIGFELVSLRGGRDRHWSHSRECCPDIPAFTAALSAPGSTDDPLLRQEVNLSDQRAPRQEHGGAPGQPPWVDTLLHPLSVWPAGMVTLADLSEAIHRATRLEVLADSFIRARIDRQAIAGRRPLHQLLDRVAAEMDYSWRKEGSLLLLRDRRISCDRPQEVPDRVVHPWRERVLEPLPASRHRDGGYGAATARESQRPDELGGRRVLDIGQPARPEVPGLPPRAVTLDDLADLAAALTDPQVCGIGNYWGWYLEDSGIAPPGRDNPSDVYDLRHHLRFWASLTPLQKRAAAAGAVIPLESMNPLQRRAFLRALEPELRDATNPFETLRPLPAELLAGGFGLGSNLLERGIYTYGDADRTVFTNQVGYGLRITPLGADGTPKPADCPPAFIDQYVFGYHLAGQQEPARTVEIQVPR
jgi:hypothetical protein